MATKADSIYLNDINSMYAYIHIFVPFISSGFDDDNDDLETFS